MTELVERREGARLSLPLASLATCPCAVGVTAVGVV